MSDFNNGFNGPEAPFEWNGSNNNNGGKRFVKILLVVLAVLALFTVTAVAVYFAEGGLEFLEITGDNSTSSSTSASTSTPSSDTSRPEYSVPDFTPSGDSSVDLTTTLTQIYDACSPSCSTIMAYRGGKPYSSGSGFVIDAENGYIATNHHVIADCDKIEVVFYDGTTYIATVVGSDATTDLAVLKIEAKNLVQVKFGDSNNIKVGEGVVAIGTPYDISLAGTMTSGIVSGLARGVEITNSSGKVIKTMTLIQTDCSINPGNSGGPLFDMAGNVIGITSLKIADELYEGIGFAIPISDATEIFKKLIAGEDVSDNGIASATPRIGVTVYAVEDGLSEYKLKPRCEYPKGLFVGEIDPNTASYRAGLSQYDIITDFNGYTITSIDDLDSAMSNYKAGDEVVVTVFRFDRFLLSGEYKTITFKLDAAQ